MSEVATNANSSNKKASRFYKFASQVDFDILA
jgi:hypothetical protein